MASLQGVRGLKDYFINLDQIQITNEKSTSTQLRSTSRYFFKSRPKR